MDKVLAYMPLLLEGTVVTIVISLASIILAVILGLIGAWGKLSQSVVANKFANAYTTLIRGIPDLVLMLLLFYGGQTFINFLGQKTGLWGYVEIDKYVAGVGTIGFIFGAYMTETFRGAYLSIPSGQIEAAKASGMSGVTVFKRIIWPQLVRYALPGFSNNWLVLLKTTALVSVLGLQELVYRANQAGKAINQVFTFMFIVLLIYLALTAISDIFLRYLDRKYSAGYKRMSE